MQKSPKKETAILAAERVSKSFGSVPVLFSVSFDIRPGEVHSLIGENGAGKSTLIKTLSGFHKPTSGRILLDGTEVKLPPNGEAEHLGIVLIHQELNLAEQMTVEENVFLGRELRRGGVLSRVEMRQKVRGYLDAVGLDISPASRISDLSIAEKQMVEIVKAISRDARVLIMDEPTAVLTEAETEIFFRQVRRLKEQGVAIVFVSHKLGEVKEISDRVTILRDGQWIATQDADQLTPDAMAQMMVGRELSDLYPPMNEVDFDADTILEVKGLSGKGIRDVSFKLRQGEILGFSGLIGAGRTAVFEAVCGLIPIENGEVFVAGQSANFGSVAKARDAGIAYLTKDRKSKGLLMQQRMRPNLTLFALNQFVKRLRLDKAAEEVALKRAIRRFDIRARDPSINVGDMSGGNQQKLLLAKVMEAEPRIVVIDEPTRGIDVGTKQQVYHFIAALAAEGVSVVVISSEMPEIIGLCHRVIVMREGRVMGSLTGDHINEAEIVRYAAGLKQEEAA
ncbi:sugar ABC transporter ATP-binding protein [Shimia abyssi]|uniref:Monosaccharide ABC transporter ATP-binding protein (CUT2 family) n=1 Tax=Shimia abyssi TaxID=1662395 RepID=A0A2P8FHE0_9RHOB|nr:sugar ABC transporter ATP-binding protein [Shimia abyssi]PSL21119.1 monosaccharide ABC transporter ATP-binding protein (CUT2 family) [Shimia abyssi]